VGGATPTSGQFGASATRCGVILPVFCVADKFSSIISVIFGC